MAHNDDLIRKNPFAFELSSVVVNDSVTREAITRKQERDLLKFISIIDKIFTLPDETMLLSGHSDKTTVGIEKQRYRL
jgi:hypothetical protein